MARSGVYIRESSVEKFLVKCVEAVVGTDETGCDGYKGICEKHVSPGRRGVPDRLITWPWASMDLVETKSPDSPELRVTQERDHAKRSVYVWKLYDKVQVARFVYNRCAQNAHPVPAIVLKAIAKHGV